MLLATWARGGEEEERQHSSLRCLAWIQILFCLPWFRTFHNFRAGSAFYSPPLARLRERVRCNVQVTFQLSRYSCCGEGWVAQLLTIRGRRNGDRP